MSSIARLSQAQYLICDCCASTCQAVVPETRAWANRSLLCFLQVPIDPLEKLSGLLDALKLMDAAVQQNIYHEKLLMYRDVRMPELAKVTHPLANNYSLRDFHM